MGPKKRGKGVTMKKKKLHPRVKEKFFKTKKIEKAAEKEVQQGKGTS